MVNQDKIIDIHSHILPGIDDGARTLTDSIDSIRELADQGIVGIIATPHFVNETTYMSPRDHNLELLKELKQQLQNESINVELYLGNEIYLDKDISLLLNTKIISTMADSKYLLVELPLDNEFPNFEEYFRELIEKGYTIILAHPERYSIIQKDYGIAQNLSNLGILFQCNYASINGKYGRAAKKLIKRFAKDKLIFAFGSDIHYARGENYVITACKKLHKYYSDRELKQLTYLNPSKIIGK